MIMKVAAAGLVRWVGRECGGRRNGPSGGYDGGGGRRGPARGVRCGGRGVGGGRGDDGGGARRGGRGRGADRGGRVPPDRVVHRGQPAGAADPVPRRGRRDGGGAPIGAVRRGAVRGRVHSGQRGDVVADSRRGAGALVGGGAVDRRAGDGALLRPGRGPALGRPAGSGDGRAGFGADAGRRGGQGLGRGPEPARPAALRGHEQLLQRLPDRREALHAGDQRAARAGPGRPAVRRLPGGPDHPRGTRGHRPDRSFRPAGRAAGAQAVRTGQDRDRGRRGDPDARAAGPVGPAPRTARPQPVAAPQHHRGGVLRRGRHRVARRAPGLPGPRVHGGGTRAHRAEPPAAHAGRDRAGLRP